MRLPRLTLAEHVTKASQLARTARGLDIDRAKVSGAEARQLVKAAEIRLRNYPLAYGRTGDLRTAAIYAYNACSAGLADPKALISSISRAIVDSDTKKDKKGQIPPDENLFRAGGSLAGFDRRYTTRESEPFLRFSVGEQIQASGFGRVLPNLIADSDNDDPASLPVIDFDANPEVVACSGLSPMESVLHPGIRLQLMLMQVLLLQMQERIRTFAVTLQFWPETILQWEPEYGPL